MVKRIVIGMIFCLVVFAYQTAGEMLYSMKAMHEGALQLRYLGEPLSASQVFHFSEEEAQTSAWTQKNDVRLGNEAFERETSENVLYSCRGDELSGPGMCAVSQDVAYNLFGEIDVAGEAISIDGELYTVERVMMEGKGIVLAEVGKDSSILFDVVEMKRYSGGALGLSWEEATALVGRAADVVLDYDSFFLKLEKIRNGAIWLPCFIMVVLGVAQMRRLWREGLEAAFCGISAVCLLAACFFALGSPFYLPERFIPTRWSDFSFWSQAFSTAIEEKNRWDTLAVYLPDLQLTRIFLAVAATAAILLILLAYFGYSIKRKGDLENVEGNLSCRGMLLGRGKVSGLHFGSGGDCHRLRQWRNGKSQL